MPKPSKGPRLGAGPAHEKLLLGTLAEQLFEHGKITTTEAKAKRLRPLAEKLITFGKKGDLAARRQVMASIANKSVVHTLFTEIAPRFEKRKRFPQQGRFSQARRHERLQSRQERSSLHLDRNSLLR